MAIAVGENAVWAIGATTGRETGYLWRIDPRSNGVTREVDLGFLPLGRLAVGLGAAWVTDTYGDAVARVDTKTGRLSRFRTGRQPQGVAVGSESVWVANNRDETVTRISPKANDLKTIEVGGRPGAVAVGAGAVWVAATER
jgi:streptogramin lyase